MAVRTAHQPRVSGRSLAVAAGVVLLSAIAFPLVSQAGEAGQPAPAMPLGAPTAAPTGFLDFCARQPAQCGLPQDVSADEQRSTLYRRYYWRLALPGQAETDQRWSGPITLASTPPRADWKDRQAPGAQPLTAELLALLNSVDRTVNHSIRYVHAGGDDSWKLPMQQAASQATGDCKDYVLEKRRALIEHGISPQSLSIALVQTWRGESHAILLVATDQGEYALDNLSGSVKRWDKLGYRWVSRQAPGETFDWVSLGSDGPG